MSRPQPRSFAPVDREEDLPEDVLHWAQLFEDVATERERQTRTKPTSAAERLA